MIRPLFEKAHEIGNLRSFSLHPAGPTGLIIVLDFYTARSAMQFSRHAATTLRKTTSVSRLAADFHMVRAPVTTLHRPHPDAFRRRAAPVDPEAFRSTLLSAGMNQI